MWCTSSKKEKADPKSYQVIQNLVIQSPRGKKTTESMREKHVGELEEDIKDINDQLLFKEKRREQAELSRNYKLCDQLTEKMSSLKKQEGM